MTPTPCKGHIHRQDAPPVQSELVFHARTLRSEVRVFAECMVRGEGTGLGS